MKSITAVLLAVLWILPARAEEGMRTQLYVLQAPEDVTEMFPQPPREGEAAIKEWADRMVMPFREDGQGLVAEMGKDLMWEGQVWARTLTTPFDPDRREKTYKVFTHLMDIAGATPITKGAGGKYTHHRGLFMGWKDTWVQGQDYDTWHMSNCTQRHERWWIPPSEDGPILKNEDIAWCDEAGQPFIREIRSITLSPGREGVRMFDFASDLISLRGDIQLRGDLQHAGMQVRLANEVSEHEDTTQYILPQGSQRNEDDEVLGAPWACCSAEVNGKRYWIMHMTPPDHPTGVPVYSIRAYARFGAFFEPDLQEGSPLTLHFRVLLSPEELTQDDCETLYADYVMDRSNRSRATFVSKASCCD